MKNNPLTIIIALELENKTIVNDAITYIKDNIDIVLKHWNGEFDEYELHNILNKWSIKNGIIR